MTGKEGYQMVLNTELIEAARRLVVDSNVALPAEIPGFPGFFAAPAADATINAIGAFVADGRSYKIGTYRLK